MSVLRRGRSEAGPSGFRVFWPERRESGADNFKELRLGRSEAWELAARREDGMRFMGNGVEWDGRQEMGRQAEVETGRKAGKEKGVAGSSVNGRMGGRTAGVSRTECKLQLRAE